MEWRELKRLIPREVVVGCENARALVQICDTIDAQLELDVGGAPRPDPRPGFWDNNTRDHDPDVDPYFWDS